MYYALMDGNRISALRVKSKYGVIDHLIVRPIRDAGKTGRLRCESCGEEVIFRCGDVRDPHFAHLAGSNCVEKTAGFSFESDAHRDGIILLQEYFQRFTTEDVCVGVRLENDRRPNLLITDENGRLAIEFVCNSLPQDWVFKNKSYTENDIPCLWIFDYSTTVSEIIRREIQACNPGNMIVYLDADNRRLVFARHIEYRDASGELVEVRPFELESGLGDTTFLMDGLRFDISFEAEFSVAYNEFVAEKTVMLARMEAEKINALEVGRKQQEYISIQRAIADSKREAAQRDYTERRKQEYQAELERQEAEARTLAKLKEEDDRLSAIMLDDLKVAAESYRKWACENSISLPLITVLERREFNKLARAYLNRIADYTDLVTLASLLCHDPNLVIKYGHDAKRLAGVFDKVKSQDAKPTLPVQHKDIDTIRNDLCPHCGKLLRVCKGPYSDFLGCTGYPSCRYTRRI